MRVVLFLVFALPASAATIAVTDPGDAGTAATCTLRQAVEAANTDAPVGACPAGDDVDDRITFAPGVTAVGLEAGQVEVTEGLEVVGPVTVTAAPGARAFLVSGGESVAFTDVTFEGGAADGGAVRIAGPTDVTITRGAARENRAPGAGGAFWVSAGGSLTLDGTELSNNSARGTGVSDGGGAIYTAGGAVALTDVTLTGNRSLGGNGGAVLSPAGAAVTISTSTLSQNRARRSGGALAVVGGSAELTGSMLLQNSALEGEGDGGALHASGGAAVTVASTDFERNLADRDGGGVWVGPGGTLTASGSVLDRNAARGNGGGLYAAPGSTIGLVGTGLRDNTALGAGGGAIYADDAALTVTATPGALEGTVERNKAESGDGGAILALGGTTTVTGVRFASNKALAGRGGAALVTGEATFTTTFTRRNQAARGGGYAVDGGGTLTIERGAANGGSHYSTAGSQNTAETGGGLYVGPGSTADLHRVRLVDHRARTGAGAFNEGGVLVADDVEFVDNRALAVPGFGGAIAATDAATTVTGGRIAYNGADGTGAAGIGATGGTLTLGGGVLFYFNRPKSGLGAAVATTGTDLVVDGATFQFNRAPNSVGGGLYVQGGTAAVSRATFDRNVALSGAGVLFLDGATFSVRETLFVGGRAEEGGGLYVGDGSSGVVENTTVYGNDAQFGGGLYVEAGADVTAEASTFAQNAAGARGGGIAAEGDTGGPGLVVIGPFQIERHRTGSPHFEGDFAERTATLRGSIVADNTAGTADPDLAGRVRSLGFNVVGSAPPGRVFAARPTDQTGADPLLLGLADNGGATLTVGLEAGSPAIDAGSTDLAVDQRGYLRADGLPDAGAFEVGAVPPSGGAPEAGLEAPSVEAPASLDVVPNPLTRSAQVTISVLEAQRLDVRVVDVMGREVARLFEGPVEARAPVTVGLDGAALAAGVYVVVVRGETVRATRTVTVVR